MGLFSQERRTEPRGGSSLRPRMCLAGKPTGNTRDRRTPSSTKKSRNEWYTRLVYTSKRDKRAMTAEPQNEKHRTIPLGVFDADLLTQELRRQGTRLKITRQP